MSCFLPPFLRLRVSAPAPTLALTWMAGIATRRLDVVASALGALRARAHEQPVTDGTRGKTFNALCWNVAGLRALIKNSPGVLQSAPRRVALSPAAPSRPGVAKAASVSVHSGDCPKLVSCHRSSLTGLVESQKPDLICLQVRPGPLAEPSQSTPSQRN